MLPPGVHEGMRDNMKNSIEDFLDDFMQVEYNGRNHLVARKHYREVFHELIPKHFAPLAPAVPEDKIRLPGEVVRRAGDEAPTNRQ